MGGRASCGDVPTGHWGVHFSMTTRAVALAVLALLPAPVARAAEPTYAQHLADTMSGRQGVLGLVIAVAKPGDGALAIIASSPGSVRPAASAQTMTAARAGRIVEVDAGPRTDVALPLLDVSRGPARGVDVALARK